MKLHISSPARNDLREIEEFIGKENPQDLREIEEFIGKENPQDLRHLLLICQL